MAIVFAATAMLGLGTARASAEEKPVWWPEAKEEAADKGYALTTPEELKSMMDSGEKFLLLDVRPDYEFRAGHIPGAENFEFHLGDRLKIGPEKKAAFERLMGTDKDRRLVIYCRSFR